MNNLYFKNKTLRNGVRILFIYQLFEILFTYSSNYLNSQHTKLIPANPKLKKIILFRITDDLVRLKNVI